MATSSNGWPAAPNLPLRPLVVGGVSFIPGILDNDDVALVLGYVAQQVHQRVESTFEPGCWGFSFRVNVNSPDVFSNHASGTAIDYNAPAHPNGVPTLSSFTAAEIAEIRLILNEVENAVRWGGDFNGTPDAMHFEINVSPAELAAVAARLKDRLEGDMPLNPEDKAWLIGMVDARLVAFGKEAGDLIKVDVDGDPATPKWSLERAIRWLKG